MMKGKFYFIVNTHSKTGGAAAEWAELESKLRELKIDYEAFITQHVHHATELARELTTSDEMINLIVCGGDGTVNEVLNGIRDLSQVVFGHIPLGSANDFARGLKITGKPVEILEKILKSNSIEAYDIGQVEWSGGSRRFAISAGAGIDAAVCREALTSKLKTFLNKFKMGSATYGLLTVKNLFSAPFVRGKITSSDGHEVCLDKVIFGAAMNFPYEGGGVPMAPHADAQDGKLSLCVAADMPKLVCLLKFPKLLAAKHEHIKGFYIIESESFKLTFDKTMVVHADGEDCGDLSEVTFRCLNQALKMPKL